MKALNCAGGMPYLQSKMQSDALLTTIPRAPIQDGELLMMILFS